MCFPLNGSSRRQTKAPDRKCAGHREGGPQDRHRRYVKRLSPCHGEPPNLDGQVCLSAARTARMHTGWSRRDTEALKPDHRGQPLARPAFSTACYDESIRRLALRPPTPCIEKPKHPHRTGGRRTIADTQFSNPFAPRSFTPGNSPIARKGRKPDEKDHRRWLLSQPLQRQ